MSNVISLFTSDPNLVRCEVARLAQVLSPASAADNAMGLGSYDQDEVLLQRVGIEAAQVAFAELWRGDHSEAFLLHTQALPVGMSFEENTQPFRYRQWLFAHAGRVAGFAQVRTRLLATLPEFLQRQIRGDTDSEASFAVFLKLLRDSGRLDDPSLEPALAGQLLGKAVRVIDQLAVEAGETGRSTLNFVATNGALLLATRFGPEPLHYTLLEGAERCARCGIEPGGPDSPKVREHRRVRTVAVASGPRPPPGWIELQAATAMVVGRNLAVQVLPI